MNNIFTKIFFFFIYIRVNNAYRSSQETLLEGAGFEYQQIGFNMFSYFFILIYNFIIKSATEFYICLLSISHHYDIQHIIRGSFKQIHACFM
jgi:hypothetical protein